MPLKLCWLKQQGALCCHLQVFDQLPLRGVLRCLGALTVLEEVVQVLILDGFEQNKRNERTKQTTSCILT